MTNIQVSYWANQEQIRHNRVTEDQGQQSINEGKRHNMATENLGFQTLSETKRHNRVTEDVSYKQLENQKKQIQIQKEQARASMKQAEAAMMNARTNRERAKYQNAYDKARSELIEFERKNADIDFQLREKNFGIEKFLSPVGTVFDAFGNSKGLSSLANTAASIIGMFK